MKGDLKYILHITILPTCIVAYNFGLHKLPLHVKQMPEQKNIVQL